MVVRCVLCGAPLCRICAACLDSVCRLYDRQHPAHGDAALSADAMRESFADDAVSGARVDA